MPDYSFEIKAKENGYKSICGIDEAGRGPLCGPVFAAAVILPENCIIEGLDDSKKLSEKKRESLFDIIKDKAVAYGIGTASEREIDEVNILNATFIAMCRAIEELKVSADYALIDGNRKPNEIKIPCETIVKGDSKSMSVAAASVLAKVSRDRFMLELDKRYPQYQLAKHKGYPTQLHRQLVNQYGPCEIYRMSFLKKVLK